MSVYCDSTDDEILNRSFVQGSDDLNKALDLHGGWSYRELAE